MFSFVEVVVGKDEEEFREDSAEGFCGTRGAGFPEKIWLDCGSGRIDLLPLCCCCCCCCCSKLALTSVELRRKGWIGGGVDDDVFRTVELLRATAVAALRRAGGTNGFPLMPLACSDVVVDAVVDDPFPGTRYAKSGLAVCFVDIGGFLDMAAVLSAVCGT